MEFTPPILAAVLGALALVLCVPVVIVLARRRTVQTAPPEPPGRTERARSRGLSLEKIDVMDADRDAAGSLRASTTSDSTPMTREKRRNTSLTMQLRAHGLFSSQV